MCIHSFKHYYCFVNVDVFQRTDREKIIKNDSDFDAFWLWPFLLFGNRYPYDHLLTRTLNILEYLYEWESGNTRAINLGIQQFWDLKKNSTLATIVKLIFMDLPKIFTRILCRQKVYKNVLIWTCVLRGCCLSLIKTLYDKHYP